jgi:hypothetical protein
MSFKSSVKLERIDPSRSRNQTSCLTKWFDMPVRTEEMGHHKPSRWKRGVVRECFRETVKELAGIDLDEGMHSPAVLDSEDGESVEDNTDLVSKLDAIEVEDWEDIDVKGLSTIVDLKPAAKPEFSRSAVVVTPPDSPIAAVVPRLVAAVIAAPLAATPAAVAVVPRLVLSSVAAVVAPSADTVLPEASTTADDAAAGAWQTVKTGKRDYRNNAPRGDNAPRRDNAPNAPRRYNAPNAPKAPRRDYGPTRLCASVTKKFKCHREGCTNAHSVAALNVKMCFSGIQCPNVHCARGVWRNVDGRNRCNFGHGDEKTNKGAYLNRIAAR